MRENQSLLNWLSHSEHESKHNAVRSSRVEGTGQWLLRHSLFEAWFNDNATCSILWCHGIQGCGKSVLAWVCSHVIWIAATDVL